jgi:predicted metal-dependent enzyme (double-stranded beta helix superfamily)
MSQRVEKFGRQAHDILSAEPGPSGRDRVRLLLEELLRDEAFVAEQLAPQEEQRRLLYKDAELGFVVLGHAFPGPRRTKPHDHGAYWAIYGQATGTTFMDEWELVEKATPERPGKVRKITTHELTPGHARTYNEGALHSPWREGPAKMIRIEGGPIGREGQVEYEIV